MKSQDDAIRKLAENATPAEAARLLESLRWDVDRRITNHDGDQVWLGPCLNEAGVRIGITDCCFVDDPCERHSKMMPKANDIKGETMKKLQACPGYVIVKRDAAITKTDSGIIIPEGQGKKPCRGVVTSMGPARYEVASGTEIPDVDRAEAYLEKAEVRHKTVALIGISGTVPPVVDGDSVVFSMYAGTEVEIGLDTFVVLKAEDILCRVVEEA